MYNLEYKKNFSIQLCFFFSNYKSSNFCNCAILHRWYLTTDPQVTHWKWSSKLLGPMWYNKNFPYMILKQTEKVSDRQNLAGELKRRSIFWRNTGSRTHLWLLKIEKKKFSQKSIRVMSRRISIVFRVDFHRAKITSRVIFSSSYFFI